jgi:hypothetical protein
MSGADEFKIVNIVGGNMSADSEADTWADEDDHVEEEYGGAAEDEAIAYFENEGGARKKRAPTEPNAVAVAPNAVAVAPNAVAVAPNAVAVAPNAVAVAPNAAAVAPNAAADAPAVSNTVTDATPKDTTTDVDADDSASQCSSDMNTASLIANGCTYTILEQMLMTEVTDNDNHTTKRNVAFMMERCAKALEGILEHLSSSSKSSSGM